MKPPGRRINNPSHEATWHNQNRDAIEDRTPKESKDIRVMDVPGGFELLLKREGIGGASPAGLACREMLITSIAQDYFFAVPAPAGGAATADAVPEQVAKPTNARGNTADFNSKTVQLQSTPLVTIVQTLVPAYTVGQRVWVLSHIDDVPDQRLEISPNREWVDPLQIVCAKVNGVDKQIYVRGSAPF